MKRWIRNNLISVAAAVVLGASVCAMADAARPAPNACWLKPAAEVTVLETAVAGEADDTATKAIDDAMLIAKLIEASAADQDSYGKRLVADVVLNRVADPEFPDTVAQVIEQAGQFVQLEDLYGLPVEKTDDAYTIACEEMLDQVSYEVLYFNGTGYVPGTEPLMHEGGQYFSR